jgi:carbonic anhydrase/acetyltransferase-like protein (isoleucine patch superfamily)
VWPGAVIRGDLGKIVIGRQTIIEDNCVIHSGSPGQKTGDVNIGDRVIAGHGAVINGRSIGNYVLIGMNATVIHNARIGDFCIIGAGTLVGEGKQIPDRSLVLGVPGKITGTPSEKQLWWVEHAYDDYRDLVRAAKEQAGH